MTYSSALSAGRQRFSVRQQNEISFRGNPKSLGPVSNSLILILLVCLLGLVYLTQVTKTNAYGYQINELNTYQSKLKDEHDQLEVAAARQQSLDRIAASEVAKNLVSAAPSATLQN